MADEPNTGARRVVLREPLLPRCPRSHVEHDQIPHHGDHQFSRERRRLPNGAGITRELSTPQKRVTLMARRVHAPDTDCGLPLKKGLVDGSTHPKCVSRSRKATIKKEAQRDSIQNSIRITAELICTPEPSWGEPSIRTPRHSHFPESGIPPEPARTACRDFRA